MKHNTITNSISNESNQLLTYSIMRHPRQKLQHAYISSSRISLQYKSNQICFERRSLHQYFILFAKQRSRTPALDRQREPRP